jgi:hypothetical protein
MIVCCSLDDILSDGIAAGSRNYQIQITEEVAAENREDKVADTAAEVFSSSPRLSNIFNSWNDCME